VQADDARADVCVVRTSRMTRAAWALLACTAVATPLITAAAPARPTPPKRPPLAHAAGIDLGVSALSADAITSTSAVLRANVTASLLGANVDFQYGTTTSYGSSSATATTSLLRLKEEIRIPVAGLAPKTTYHYRAVVWSGSKVKYGKDQWLTTADAAAATPADQGAAPDDGSSGSGDDGSGTDNSGSGSDDSGSGSGTTPTGGAPSSTTPATTTPSGGSGSGKDSDRSSSGESPASGGSGSKSADTPTYDGPKPVLGQSVGVQPVNGVVTVLSPAGQPVPLADATALPTGTIVDTTRGTVALTTALADKGKTQTGKFWGGVFEVRQDTAGKGLTQLVLRGGDFSACPAGTVSTDAAAAGASLAAAAATLRVLGHGASFTALAAATKKKPPRRLWGSDKGGRFQTRGRGSVATVRGTRWSTEDWCQGTVTRVLDGAVAVRDLHRKRTKLVKKGHSYYAYVGG
jgi:hypothetical protein